jgi:hypothetical protein
MVIQQGWQIGGVPPDFASIANTHSGGLLLLDLKL